MDQAQEHDVNIHDTLEATLAILQHRLVHVGVSRDDEPDVCDPAGQGAARAHGGAYRNYTPTHALAAVT